MVLVFQIDCYYSWILGWFANLNQLFKASRFYDFRKKWAGVMMESLVVNGP